MIAVVQRVRSARVTVGQSTVGRIEHGLVVLASIVTDDSDRDLEWMSRRIISARVFPSDSGAFDHDVKQVGGGVLLVSNFTVAADTTGGRRPGFSRAMSPEQARPVFQRFVDLCRAAHDLVATGEFGADMLVEIANDGPATFIFDSR
jgi:D-aminoacyl-tRNA deacylase